MTLSEFHTIWTCALLLGFVCLIAWAFSRQRRASFDEAARLPLEESASAETTETAEEGSQSEHRCSQRLLHQ